jgi:SAM-dependent methyltransferase
MVAPYDALAAGYDAVMSHVDYDAWARFVHTLLERHGTAIYDVLELAGGTGALAQRLQPLGPYRYTLTDGSTAMLQQAARKLAAQGAPIRCQRLRFQNLSLNAAGRAAPVDAVVLVYDGLNYLHTPTAVADLLTRIHDVLRPGGLCVLDHATPANSEAHADTFSDEGTSENFSYVRESRYDAATQQHVTTFTLSIGGEPAHETHVQRVYPPSTLRTLLHDAPLEIVAAYDGFTDAPAQAGSHRVHWVARRPPDSSPPPP